MIFIELLRSFLYELGADTDETAGEHALSLVSDGTRTFIDGFASFTNGKKLVSWVQVKSLNLSPNDDFVAVVPIGNVKRADLAVVCRSIRLALGCEVRLLRRRPLYSEIFDVQKNTLDGDKTLNFFAGSREFPGTARIIAVTDQAISTSVVKSNVYGLAFMKSPVGLVSTLLASSEFVNRMSIIVVTLHELGHTYGLEHCQNDGCIMQIIPQLVASSVSFCNNCECKIKKGRSNV